MVLNKMFLDTGVNADTGICLGRLNDLGIEI